jgi:DNA-binding NarL/FixJ family response regulator
LAKGKTRQEIAEELGITQSTVSWYTARIMQRNGLYGSGDGRRLIVMAVRGELRA